jgi:signal transduction histidine kinase
VIAMSELSLASAQVLSSVVSDASYPQGLLAWNMLVNAGIPAVLVDARLAVKFVTPAAASLLKLGDAEKELPLESFQGIIRDPALLADAQHVLREQAPVERVIALQQDRWYLRRMAPYRTTAMSCDGVVVILTDITDRERVARSLKSGKQQAEMASAANMRRLSAVCHDLRQPLNTLGLIGGLLAQSFRDPLVQRLAQLLDDSLQAMSGMLSSAHFCAAAAGILLSLGCIRIEAPHRAIEPLPAQRLCALRADDPQPAGAPGQDHERQAAARMPADRGFREN